MNQMAHRRLYRFGNSTLALEFADITSSEAQVLVSSDDRSLTMGGGVSGALRRAGGNSIALDVAKKIPVALGDVVVTTAGALQAHYIFHAVTLGVGDEQTDPLEIIERTTRRCIQLVDALGAHSIAFPAIGAGSAGFSYEDVAAKMAEVIADELHRVRPVDVAIYFHDPYNPERFDQVAFAEEFARRESHWQAVPDSAMPHDARSSDKHVFISYSHRDKTWLRLLQDMLQPLLRKRSISIWDDTQIRPGADWRKEIQDALAAAKVAVLLVSKDFLASTFIDEHELPQALEAAKTKGLTILWVYLSPCLYYNETEIAVYQAAHEISRPLNSLKGAKREEALVAVCQTIKAAMSV